MFMKNDKGINKTQITYYMLKLEKQPFAISDNNYRKNLSLPRNNIFLLPCNEEVNDILKQLNIIKEENQYKEYSLIEILSLENKNNKVNNIIFLTPELLEKFIQQLFLPLSSGLLKENTTLFKDLCNSFNAIFIDIELQYCLTIDFVAKYVFDLMENKEHDKLENFIINILNLINLQTNHIACILGPLFDNKIVEEDKNFYDQLIYKILTVISKDVDALGMLLLSYPNNKLIANNLADLNKEHSFLFDIALFKGELLAFKTMFSYALSVHKENFLHYIEYYIFCLKELENKQFYEDSKIELDASEIMDFREVLERQKDILKDKNLKQELNILNFNFDLLINSNKKEIINSLASYETQKITWNIKYVYEFYKRGIKHKFNDKSLISIFTESVEQNRCLNLKEVATTILMTLRKVPTEIPIEILQTFSSIVYLIVDRELIRETKWSKTGLKLSKCNLSINKVDHLYNILMDKDYSANIKLYKGKKVLMTFVKEGDDQFKKSFIYDLIKAQRFYFDGQQGTLKVRNRNLIATIKPIEISDTNVIDKPQTSLCHEGNKEKVRKLELDLTAKNIIYDIANYKKEKELKKERHKAKLILKQNQLDKEKLEDKKELSKNEKKRQDKKSKKEEKKIRKQKFKQISAEGKISSVNQACQENVQGNIIYKTNNKLKKCSNQNLSINQPVILDMPTILNDSSAAKVKSNQLNILQPATYITFTKFSDLYLTLEKNLSYNKEGSYKMF